MASRIVRKLQCFLLGAVDIAGSFAPNGSSALVAANTYGKGFSVARSNTGLYTITLEDKWAKLISATCSLQLATGGDQKLEFGSYSAANRTITIRCWDISGAAVADVAADANNRIHFRLLMTNSSYD